VGTIVLTVSDHGLSRPSEVGALGLRCAFLAMVCLASRSGGAMVARDDADRRLGENVAAARVQAAPAHGKKAAAAAVQAAPDEKKGEVAAAAVQAAPDEMKGKVAAAAVRAVPDKLKTEVAAAAVQAAPDEMKGKVAAAAVDAVPDDLEGKVAAAAVQAVVNSKESNLRKVVTESLTEALRPPVVSNVEGSLRLSAGPESADRLELTVTIATGPEASRDAARHPATRAFRLTGGKDQPTAPFEISVDAPGLHVDSARTSIELSTFGGSHEWSFSVLGDRVDEMPIWVTLYSSGRYVQAIKWTTESKDQGDGHG